MVDFAEFIKHIRYTHGFLSGRAATVSAVIAGTGYICFVLDRLYSREISRKKFDTYTVGQVMNLRALKSFMIYHDEDALEKTVMESFIRSRNEERDADLRVYRSDRQKCMTELGKVLGLTHVLDSAPATTIIECASEDYEYDDDEEEEDEDGSDKSMQSRSEKKSLKAMLRLGMKPMPGVSHVAIRKGKNVLLVISKADVYKSPMSEMYVVINEEKNDDLSLQLKSQAAEQFRAPDFGNMTSKPEASTGAPDDEDDDMDETGVEAEDIELVMTLTGVPRSKAVKALKIADGGEKKSGKAMLTLGMEPMPGVSSVAFKKGKKIFVIVSNPDVYQSPTSETYVVIGEEKIHDLNLQLQSQAALFRAPNLSDMASKPTASTVTHDDDDDVDVILNTDVYQSPTSETYVVIGEEKIHDLNSQLQSQAAEQFRAPNLSDMASKPKASTVAHYDDDEDNVDEIGVEAKETEFVMAQAGSEDERL